MAAYIAEAPNPAPIEITATASSGTALSSDDDAAQHAEPGSGEPQQAERALAVGQPGRHARRQGAAGDGQAGQDHHVGELLVGVVRRPVWQCTRRCVCGGGKPVPVG